MVTHATLARQLCSWVMAAGVVVQCGGGILGTPNGGQCRQESALLVV